MAYLGVCDGQGWWPRAKEPVERVLFSDREDYSTNVGDRSVPRHKSRTAPGYEVITAPTKAHTWHKQGKVGQAPTLASTSMRSFRTTVSLGCQVS